MGESKGKLMFDLILDTDKFSKVLDIAAKHLKNLSEDLKKIGSIKCPECGSVAFVPIESPSLSLKYFKGIALIRAKCSDCGNIHFREVDNDCIVNYDYSGEDGETDVI